MSIAQDDRPYHLNRARDAILCVRSVYPAVPAVAVDTPEEKEEHWDTCPTPGLVLFVRATGQFWCWTLYEGWVDVFSDEEPPRIPEPEVPFFGLRRVLK